MCKGQGRVGAGSIRNSATAIKGRPTQPFVMAFAISLAARPALSTQAASCAKAGLLVTIQSSQDSYNFGKNCIMTVDHIIVSCGHVNIDHNVNFRACAQSLHCPAKCVSFSEGLLDTCIASMNASGLTRALVARQCKWPPPTLP